MFDVIGAPAPRRGGGGAGALAHAGKKREPFRLVTIRGFSPHGRIDLIPKVPFPFLGPPAFRGRGSWCGGGGAREFGAASREGGFREGDFTRAGGSGRYSVRGGMGTSCQSQE